VYHFLEEQARESLNVPAYLIPTEPTAQEASASSLFAVLPYHEGLPDDAVLSASPAETYPHLEGISEDTLSVICGYF
jgi:hypothetical protein